MATAARRPLAEAYRIAQALVAELTPACERIAIAGSIRRRRPDIADVELVAMREHTPEGWRRVED